MINKIYLLLLFFCFLSIDAYAQALDLVKITKFVHENAITISKNPQYSQLDWNPILEVVKDKQYVAIGECNHGSKEIFSVRNNLIYELHSKLGFNLILFESGLGEVGVINLQKANLEGSQLVAGFFEGWRTKEFEELLEYTREKDLAIAGYDVQRTGNGFVDYFTALGSAYKDFSTLEENFVQVKAKLNNPSTKFEEIKDETRSLISNYRDYIKLYPGEMKWVVRTLENRVYYLSYMLEFVMTKNWNNRWKARDLGMANNVKFILSRYPEGTKAIIIGHNYHLSRFNGKEEVMGEFLDPVLGKDTYVIGVFAARGSYSNNSGEEEKLSEPDTLNLDIKHFILADKAAISFMNLHNLKGDAGWLFRPIVVNDTFIDLSGTQSMVLGFMFDGLLLFDTVSAAHN